MIVYEGKIGREGMIGCEGMIRHEGMIGHEMMNRLEETMEDQQLDIRGQSKMRGQSEGRNYVILLISFCIIKFSIINCHIMFYQLQLIKFHFFILWLINF